MGRDFARGIGFALVLALPGVVVVAALFGIGLLGAEAAAVAAGAIVVLAILSAVPLVVSLEAARRAIERLGPDASGAAASAAPTGRR
ncbi:MAG TPA: hypothetical protein VNF04_09385, partial [Stellaceae bacterium]|nr:hypothetical protein [Stellaceae bacterium]